MSSSVTPSAVSPAPCASLRLASIPMWSIVSARRPSRPALSPAKREGRPERRSGRLARESVLRAWGEAAGINVNYLDRLEEASSFDGSAGGGPDAQPRRPLRAFLAGSHESLAPAAGRAPRWPPSSPPQLPAPPLPASAAAPSCALVLAPPAPPEDMPSPRPASSSPPPAAIDAMGAMEETRSAQPRRLDRQRRCMGAVSPRAPRRPAKPSRADGRGRGRGRGGLRRPHRAGRRSPRGRPAHAHRRRRPALPARLMAALPQKAAMFVLRGAPR
jgi:hypothetical protein